MWFGVVPRAYIPKGHILKTMDYACAPKMITILDLTINIFGGTHMTV
jgi:hypothetical protein